MAVGCSDSLDGIPAPLYRLILADFGPAVPQWERAQAAPGSSSNGSLMKGGQALGPRRSSRVTQRIARSRIVESKLATDHSHQRAGQGRILSGKSDGSTDLHQPPQRECQSIRG